MSRVGIVCVVVLAATGILHAEIPTMITYQGMVTDATGDPVADGDYTMRFKLYGAETGGTAAWDSGDTLLALARGVFNILLGAGTQPPIELAFDQDYWLEVIVEEDLQSPRTHIGSVGYAFMASGLVPGTDVVGEITTASMAALKGSNTALSGSTAGVTGECASPDGAGLMGVCVATTGVGRGVFGETQASDGAGVVGVASATGGSPSGVRGETGSTSGAGVRGIAAATDGYTYGVYGEAASTVAHAVHGQATATTGYADGVYGKSQSTDGKGVHGEATATTGVADGLFGRTASTEGHGVYGLATATDGYTYGVWGESRSNEGTGVYGLAPDSGGHGCGVYGGSGSISGVGVWGCAYNTWGFPCGGRFESAASGATGVEGCASASTGPGMGVYGVTNSPSGYAGYFHGDVYVSGSINKAACSFLIDHPLDPENRLLRHNCMESPEHLVVYRGKVRLDAQGEAAVEMPEYFKALTEEDEATIHLTSQGRPFPTGYAWSPDHRSFTAYGEPEREVSWMVMAERDDPVIRQMARLVEEDKGPDNKFCARGELLHPAAYGYPESMGRDYERREEARLRMEGERARMDKERARMEDERARMVDTTAGLQR